LRQVPGVAKVQLDYERQAFQAPNDPYYGVKNAITQRPYMDLIRMSKAWNISRGSKHLKIAILDTGVDPTPDLSGRLKPGYNFVAHNTNTRDVSGHGTVVAGIAAAATNNGREIAGVAWHARIMPVVVLNSLGTGTDADIARGITWATDHRADVINMSLGGPARSGILHAAIKYAHRKGVVVVAAAGNDGARVPEYPAAYRPVVAVTAVGGDPNMETIGEFAWFSNYGDWVDIAAPGTNILSTTPVGVQAITAGTSLAAPFVAGVVVLMESHHPGWSPQRIVAYLEARAKDMGPPGIDPFYGHGLLDAYAALGGPKQPRETFNPGDLPGEPADTPARAVPITTTGSGTIYPEGDVDWFSTTASSPGALSVTVTPPLFRSILNSGDPVRTSEMIADVTIYGPDLKLLGHRYGTVLNNTSTVTVPVAKAGVYYIKIANLLGSRGPIEDGPYSVSVAGSSTEVPPAFNYAQWYRSPETSSTVMADVAGDRHRELLVATTQGLHGGLAPHVLVFANGSRTHSRNLLGRFPKDHHLALAAGDLNGDGRRDVAVLTGPEVRIFHRTSRGLSAPTSVAIPHADFVGDQSVLIDDMNGDGLNDLIVQAPGAQIYVLTQTAHGFKSQTIGQGLGIRTADVTGDGRPDIIAYLNADNVTAYSRVLVFAQQPDGTFVKRESQVGSGNGVGISDVGVGDLTGDGRVDVAADVHSIDPSGEVLVFAQDQNGSLSSPDSYPVDHNIAGMAVKDVNGDGRADVVASDNEALDVLLQRSNGTLGATVDYKSAAPLVQFSGEPFVGDVNGDGSVDILTPVTTGLDILTAPSGSALAKDSRPIELATGVSRRVHPSIVMVPTISQSSISRRTVRLINADTGRPVPGTRSYDPTTARLTFRPASALSPSTPYLLLVRGLKNSRGRVVQDHTALRFTTGR
jgi:hypothetical protein